MASSPKYKHMEGMQRNLVEDEYHLLITCSTYMVIREKYDDILDMHGNMSVIHRFTPRRVSTCTCIIFHLERFYFRVIPNFSMCMVLFSGQPFGWV